MKTLDRFGRIVVPKDIRDHVGLRPGMEIEIVEKENELVLRPVDYVPPLKLKKGILVFSGKATINLRDAVKAHRAERLRKGKSRKKS